MNFMKEIKKLRKQTGLSQSKFAAAARINVRTLQDWECGRRSPDYPEHLLTAIREFVRDQLKKKKNEG